MKKITIIAVALLLLALLSQNAQAVDAQEQNNIYSEIYSASGASELKEYLSKDAQTYLKKLGCDEPDSEELMSISFGSIFKMISDIVKNGIKTPMKAMLTACAATILSSLCLSFFSAGSSGSSAAGLICGCFTIMSIYACCNEVLKAGISVIKLCAGFEKALVPVLASVITASGNPSLALTWSSASFGAAQVIESMSDDIILPVIMMCTALGMIGSLISSPDLSSLSGFIRKTLIATVSSASLLFTGFIGVKGILANSADSMINRGVKLAASTFVPVVGGAVGEAYSAVIACVCAMRNTVGIYAVVALSIMCIPVVTELFLWAMSMRCAQAIAKMTGSTQCAGIIDSFAFMFTMLNIIILITAAIFIISAGLTVIIKN